jgi:hypothetical protein
MYRHILKNKTTGLNELLWVYVGNDGNEKLYKDLTMKNEVCGTLYEKFNEDESKSFSPTPYNLFGVECGRGWYPLIQPVFDYIDEYNKDKDEKYCISVLQVKEKYGTLRIYTNFETPELCELIEHAEEESGNVCEYCGSREHIGSTLEWYITICYDCMKERVNKRECPSRWHSYDDDKVYLASPHIPDVLIGTIDEYEKTY